MIARLAIASVLVAGWSYSLFLLLTGSPLLLRPALQGYGMPVGTLVTWAAFLAMPAAVLCLSPRLPGRLERLLWIAVGLAAAWGFVSYLLADNWSFNFGNSAESFRGSVFAGRIFRWYSVTVGGLPFLAVLAALLVSLCRRLFSRVSEVDRHALLTKNS